ncbi:MAG TPA: CARDB domain-containing protein [Actinomycetota bacterium]|nr:CARDB domain-containing protein [Actinomycetota bacterium]
MARRSARLAVVAAMVAALVPALPRAAVADHGQPALDPTKIDYTPIGYYGPPDEAGTLLGESATIPTPGAYPMAPPFVDSANPSGKWVAYDTNVWESLSLPSRHPGDNCNSLPPAEQHPDCRLGDRDPDGDGPAGYTGPGGTSNVHGLCPPSPGFISGECFNSQLEYLDYFENAMESELADFGVVVHRYGFQSPGTGSRGQYLDASGGQGYNIAAVVPGADHPEETVLVSGHYDFTDSGPGAAWDSAEGHTEVIRMAYIMADYWRKTGTRPSATVKFIPWDSEESGTHGSADYVANNIPPGEEGEVRGYFNVDPCAGAYPAFKEGTAFTEQVPEVMQLADPTNFPAGSSERSRIEAFNAKAELVMDQVFENLDDTITTPTGERPIFVADSEAGGLGVPSQRDMVVTAVGGLLIFSSDYRNFEAVGIPIFNLFPDYFGPHADGTPASSEGITILHTPNDNLTRINKLTSGLTSPGNLPDATGTFASEGWAKGIEFCAQTEAWYMLQPEMAGTQTSTTGVVAYFEALPNEAIQNQNVTFDAGGSYQYLDATTRTLQPDAALTYTWDFGDGTPSGTGKVVQHAYAEIGRYDATLTVSGAGGSLDNATIPITVIGSNFAGPFLHPIDQLDSADGNFTLDWDFTATRDGFDHFRVDESTDFQTLFTDDNENIALNWTVTPGTSPQLERWQHSDSNTPKFRGNQMHSGLRSFWTGVSPQHFNPGVQNDSSILTLNEPIAVPSSGDPQLSYWSLFQNEGDDQGRVEVALTDGVTPPSELDWQAVDVIQATMTALGQEDPAICDPSNPDTLSRDFESRTVSLAGFKGKDILIRFHYRLGPENRALSQPCGWYVDDVRVESGTFATIGTTGDETFQVTGRTNGTYAYRIVGVYTDGVSTAPSNVETALVTEANLPDLVVSNITAANNKNVREGQKVTITATIRNQGDDQAGPSKTEFLLDGTTVLGLVDTPAIAAGASVNVSVQWDTRDVKGQHQIKVTADRTNQVSERVEANNSATLTVEVQGNKVKNGQFEQANESGTGPANWEGSDTDAGTTSWNNAGSDGSQAASIQGTGGSAAASGSPTWTSDPVSVTAGEALDLVVSVKSTGASSAATAGLIYLGAAGQVLEQVKLITAPLTTEGFATFENRVTLPPGVVEVRVVLTGFAPTDLATAGTVTFDDVGLYSS